MQRNALLVGLAAALLAGVGLGLSQFTGSSENGSLVQDPQGPDGPLPPDAAKAQRTTTLMLTLQVDAEGVKVVGATRKPDLGYTPVKHPESRPFQWTMRDAQGAELAAGAFDPGTLCLDPAHFGQPGHVRGDIAYPHVVHLNVKVPDLKVFDRIEFRRVAAGGTTESFGSVSRKSLTVQ
ncbi:MAG: hypothetical protein RL148_2998 [Planctomycetota bacterium]|jgi:hypothetical protein